MRFRQEQVASMVDIKAMFHQIKVAEEHTDYLRFVWWPQGNLVQELEEHRMTVIYLERFHHPVSPALLLERQLKITRPTFHQK